MAEQVIPFSLPFSQQQIERAFSPLARLGALQVRKVFAGNINVILKVESGSQSYGMRVRIHESVYRYEPDLMKEVFILRLLQQAGKAPNDALVAEAFRRLRQAQCGTVHERCDGAPTVRYFDWSRQRLPHPYCIYDWVEGTPLVDSPAPDLYAQAGGALARIHQVRFSAFYADFLSIGTAPLSWSERYRAALAKENAAAKPYLPQRVSVALDSVSIPVAAPCVPCLAHNDFAPGNILVRDGRIAAIIDWDNAVIEAPHLDFVKMKYWTARNAAGELAHDPELFSAFVDGYGTTGREIINSSLFTLYEILWLLRVFNFERSKEARGLARAPGYPAAREYEKLLTRLLRMVD
jgi:aminoglycoside phosphotransferase (APT) family kinase protein